MATPLELSVVRIYSNSGKVVGAGFLVSQKYILTCAHVVADALGIARNTAEIINAEVRLDFPLLAAKEFLTARVVFWRPVNPNEFAEDIAGLELESSLPGAAHPARLVASEELWGHSFRVLGFPKNQPNGVWATGQIRAGLANGWVQLEDVKQQGYALEPGFSGAPIWDEQLQGVAGIAVAAEMERTAAKAAFIIPTQVLITAWSDLVEQALSLEKMQQQPKVKRANDSARVFISYRSQDPDLTLAQQFYEAIKAAGHEAFMAGESIRFGENWPERIDRELEQSDYFLLLLSPKSATSEMVTEEVRRAKQLQDLNPENKPIILPIRVNFPLDSPLNYDLRGYLQRIQQREWKSSADTVKISQEILTILAEDYEANYTEDELTTAVAVENLEEPPLPVAEPELPEGQVDMASAFYIERPPIEEHCYEAILKPGSLIRIKAPRQMGKTSLMARILHQASQQNSLAVSLSFQLADSKVFPNLDKFLRWFCASVTRKLRIPNRLADYWDEIFGSKDNCTAYFEEYLLAEIDQPLALGLDEVDLVYQHPEIAADFFGLLRAWHEDAKNRDIWKKLRLVVVHSTEVYIPMNINQSPFNVGLSIELPEFNAEQAQDLARRHGLNWRSSEIEQLMNMVGGHPYLVRVALYRIARQEIALEQLLQVAPTDAGPFGDHLHRHWWNLKQHPELARAMKQIVAKNTPIQLEPIEAFKLKSMGLVDLENNYVIPRFNLYRQYFRDRAASL
ncbi:MAG: AAA-like domain-containing protein [Nostoc sp. EfeVER01]|uniref:AAA-like domain-containing protein n=1 Tax=unclassified Nostoc TaxID=2593658 RepID=UPI002AD3BA02|nr:MULTISPECIES: AAA-like domain-containing protein [unclassified Nostoc]MDZ7947334.1 AAA-like domain-containing protein [Nostoc sp. EfeVER01]MDZ7994594.1 AAA-like domain-containing protein [Nostoc sp. EspVER01]